MEVFGTIEPGGLMDQFLKQKLKENINKAFDNIKHVTTLLQNINTLLAEIPEPIKHILNLGFVANLYVDNKQVFVQTTGTYGALKSIVKDTENLIEDKHREEEKKYEETKKKLKEILRNQSEGTATDEGKENHKKEIGISGIDAEKESEKINNFWARKSV